MSDNSKIKIMTAELVEDEPMYLIWQPEADQPEWIPASEAHRKYEKELLIWYESSYEWQSLIKKRKNSHFSPMSNDSVFEILSHTADDELETVFGETYSQLIQHFESSREQRYKSICVFKRFLNLECLSKARSLVQLTRICSDLTPLYAGNLSKVDQLIAPAEEPSCDQYCSLVRENCQILSCIQNVIDKVGPHKPVADVQPIISDVISILSATFKHCNDYSPFYASAAPIFSENINNLFKVCNELLFKCLDLIDTVKIDYDMDIERLNNILESAFHMGTLVSNLELKTMAQLWKSFTSLLQKHSIALRGLFNVSQAISYFCVEIEQKIDSVYKIPAKNRSVTLKVLNFLLKVVLKLCEYFSGRLHKCLPSLCQLISLLYQNSGMCAKYEGRNSNIAAEIETNLLPAVDPLIVSLMKEDSFVKHFSELKKTNVAALMLLSVILQKLVLSPPEFLECELFEAVFQNISSCSTELHFDVRIAIVPSTSLQLPQEVYLYDALVVHTASLIISVVSEQDFHRIEQLLITHLLQSSVGMKLFICDLWCVLVRYGSSELCFEHAKLLMRVLQQIHHQKLETVIIKSLLKRFFKFLSRAQQQKFINFVSNDLSLLVEVVHPQLNCTLSILDESFVTNVSKRVQELSESSGISSWDIDLLLIVRVACNIVEFEQPIKEYILSVWSQVQFFQPSDCELTLRCIQHLVIVSKNLMLPHGATLPVIKRFLNSESVFLKILGLNYLKSLGERKADDLGIDKYCSSVSSLFRVFLKDQNVLIREQAVETFSYFSHVTVYEKIIHITIGNEPDLTSRVKNFLQNKVDPSCEKTCDDFLKTLMENRRLAVVTDRSSAMNSVKTDSDSPQPKKIKLDFEFETEIAEIDSRLKLLSSKLNSYELSPSQRNTLKHVIKIADGLRRHL